MKKWLSLSIFLFQLQSLAEPKIQKEADYFTSTQDELAWFQSAQDQLPRESTRGLFLRVYHSVSEEMPQMFAEHQFENPEWVHKLMLKYVSLYRNALECSLANSCPVSQAWQSAFSENDRNKMAPTIQLLLSISAHVNRDLPIALSQVQTNFEDASVHRDFQRISLIFTRRMPELLGLIKDYQSCTVSTNESLLINKVIQWAMNRTRETSWRFGAQLGAVKTDLEEQRVLEKIEKHTKKESQLIKILGPTPEDWLCR